MKYLRIENAGEIDINAVMLLGASSKEGDASKIGFFGSGNKYAIATLLRNGVGLHIYAGSTEFVLTTERIIFRDKDFDQILINGEKTSLTTRTGPAWEVWMALREFFCNAIDEGGESWGLVGEVTGAEPGTTAIYVEVTAAVAEMFQNLGNYINDTEPLITVETRYGKVDIISGTEGKLFRKGVRVNTGDAVSLFHYDFDNVTINESRLLASHYEWRDHMTAALFACTNKKIVAEVVNAFANDETQGIHEDEISWYDSSCGNMSPVWKEVVLDYNMVLLSRTMASVIPNEDCVGKLMLPNSMVERLHKEFPDLPVHGDLNSSTVDAVPSAALKARVKTALAELTSFGIKTRAAVMYCHFSCGTSLACVKDGQIRISVDMPNDIDLTVVLFEEIKHHDTGWGDGSRSLQTHLMEEIVTKNRELVAMEEKFLANAKKLKQAKALLSA